MITTIKKLPPLELVKPEMMVKGNKFMLARTKYKYEFIGFDVRVAKNKFLAKCLKSGEVKELSIHSKMYKWSESNGK